MSAYDVSFTFVRTQAPPADKTKPQGVEITPMRGDEITVSMSPSHAKAMLPTVYRFILEYEKKFGEIPLPPEVKDDFAKTFKK